MWKQLNLLDEKAYIATKRYIKVPLLDIQMFLLQRYINVACGEILFKGHLEWRPVYKKRNCAENPMYMEI